MDWTKIREEGFAGFSMSVMPPAVDLPVLPHAITLFLQRSADESVELTELVRIVETDAGLTVELLKHVNSAHFAVRSKTKTVLQALTLLGREQTRLFVITTGTQGTIRARKSKLINQNGFWTTSLQRALFAREVAALLNADGDVAFAGALLQDYLLPVLTNDLFDSYLDFVQARETLPETLSGYEQNFFGWDHGLAGACLAYQWNLPDEIVCCILLHHSGLKILSHPTVGRTAVAAVALSALLPDQLRQHFHGFELLARLEQSWPAFKLEQLADAVDRQQEAMGLGVRNDFPLLRRCKSLAAEGLQGDAAKPSQAAGP